MTPQRVPANDAGALDPRRWRALAVCLIAGFMTLLDVSIVNVALPSMQRGLGASPADVSWVVSGYTLTFGLALVPAGKLGDLLGRKTMFLGGLAFFTAVSVLCALSPNPTWLVVARLLQGVAGGLLNPQVIGMVQQLFRGPERGRAFGLYGASIAISTAVGPLAGGLLIQAAGVHSGWRWVFLVNLPIGLLAVVLGALWLPRTAARGTGRGLDLVGVLLLGGGVAAVLLPMIEQEQRSASVRWWLLGLAAVLLVCFVGWETVWRRAGHDPLVDLSLLRARSFGAGSAVGSVYFAGYTGLLLVLTLYLQQGHGYSALAAGATGLPFALGSAVTSTLGGRAVFRAGRTMVVAGIAAVALGLGGTAAVIGHHPHGQVWLYVLAPLLVAGLGSGLVIGPNQTLALADVPPARSGTAAAVLQTGQRVGTSLGTAVAATLFYNRLAATRSDFPRATSHSLYGATALTCVALLIAGVDRFLPRRAGNETRPPLPADSPKNPRSADPV
ncbi:DHA2 family efflux MFS transporter permease subunit [Streptomyces sp. SID685]|uniref:MFS transporter n=1 Tax=Streptomyces TaxID=1883 RepID=UPI001368B9B9|nr:MFS transporter [Streptomyces sp. SID685]MYR85240.1 DHA2 family efflux MFS transporter permease subunit [Streptomyces sp. SID685]